MGYRLVGEEEVSVQAIDVNRLIADGRSVNDLHDVAETLALVQLSVVVYSRRMMLVSLGGCITVSNSGHVGSGRAMCDWGENGIGQC